MFFVILPRARINYVSTQHSFVVTSMHSLQGLVLPELRLTQVLQCARAISYTYSW